MKISEIWIYPVKSLGGVNLQSSEIDEHGFRYDRQYMIVEPDHKTGNHKFFTQRECPQLTLVKVSINEGLNELNLYYPPQDISLTLPLVIPYDNLEGATKFRTFIWGEQPESIDLSGLYPEIGLFFDKIRRMHGSKTTIVAPYKRRKVIQGIDTSVAERIASSSFQDYFPGNVICQASLDDLNARVKSKGIHLTSQNFRPNMVFETSGAWDEDDWKKLQIAHGTSKSTWLVPCRNIRCRITTVNLKTGMFEQSHEPYKTLQSFRRIDKGRPYLPCFGMNLVNNDVGFRVYAGDNVKILERGDHCYPPIGI